MRSIAQGMDFLTSLLRIRWAHIVAVDLFQYEQRVRLIRYARAFFRHQRHPHEERGRLSVLLAEKVGRLADAFSRIATAQIKISAMNTLLTAIYLFGILPLFSRRLPFSTTIVLVTFVCGLIPVLGNLVSNTVIVILSMGVSFPTAIASLIFLILIHKLEYIVNSRIVAFNCSAM